MYIPYKLFADKEINVQNLSNLFVREISIFFILQLDNVAFSATISWNYVLKSSIYNNTIISFAEKTSTMRCIRPWPLFATLLTLSTLLPVFAKDGEMQQRVPPHDVISRPVLHVKWGRWGSERTLEPPSKRTSEKSLNRPWRTLRSLFLQLTVPDMRIRRWFWWFVIKKLRKVI